MHVGRVLLIPIYIKVHILDRDLGRSQITFYLMTIFACFVICLMDGWSFCKQLDLCSTRWVILMCALSTSYLSIH